MTRQNIILTKPDWEITIFYDSDKGDADEILHTLDIVGCDDDTYFQALDNLQSGEPNSGLTFTNYRTRESVIVLSHTTSKAEFANTWMHELIHCTLHIATALGIDPLSETLAYIAGDLAMEMQPKAAHLMCPTCKKE